MEAFMSPPEPPTLVIESVPAIFLTLLSVFPIIMDDIFPVDYSKINIRTVEEVSIPPGRTIEDTALTKSGYAVINSGNMGIDGTGLGLHV